MLKGGVRYLRMHVDIDNSLCHLFALEEPVMSACDTKCKNPLIGDVHVLDECTGLY